MKLPSLSHAILANWIALCLWNSPPATAAETAPAPALEVKAVNPRVGTITRNVVLPASIKPYQQATLYAKVAGYLKNIAIDKGDQIKEGTLLAEIEAPELIADLAKFKAEAELARLDFQRTADAQKKAPDLVVIQSVDSARAKLEVAKANLERIERLLGFAQITAPFSGVVTARFVDAGAFIPAATSGTAAQQAALATIMDFSKVRVQVAVPELEVPLIKNGLPIAVNVEELPGRRFDGVVTRFAFALDETTKTMLTEAELPNPKWDLRPGMFATVKIGVETKTNALLMPIDALVVERAGAFAFTAVNNRATKIALKTGFNDGENVEILSGVTPNDRVILVGKRTLNPGQPVKLIEGP